MAGHSKFANIKHRKGAQDKKRANLFTKLAREIIVAAKMGTPDPTFNPRLRLAIAKAKSNSMPKDKIENAIKKATAAGDDSNFEEIRYEGYAPAGVALIIETLSDNRNRTVGEVRSTISKAGGNLGESGSVAFMFDRVGLFRYSLDTASDDDIFEAAIEAGAENCETIRDEEFEEDNLKGGFHEITCDAENFNEVQSVLMEKFGDPELAKLSWNAKSGTPVDEETAEKIESLIDKLQDLDDVQDVYSNYEIG